MLTAVGEEQGPAYRAVETSCLQHPTVCHHLTDCHFQGQSGQDGAGGRQGDSTQ